MSFLHQNGYLILALGHFLFENKSLPFQITIELFNLGILTLNSFQILNSVLELSYLLVHKFCIS
jgi:hypothetical protein